MQTYLVVAEPDDFEVGELMEILQKAQVAITEMDFSEILGVLPVLNRQDRPWISNFDIKDC